MARAWPRNPTLRDSLDSADQPGSDLGPSSSITRAAAREAHDAHQSGAKLPLSTDSVFPLPTSYKRFP